MYAFPPTVSWDVGELVAIPTFPFGTTISCAVEFELSETMKPGVEAVEL